VRALSNHAQIGRAVVDDPPARKNKNSSECGECGKAMGDDNECRTVKVTPNILKNECFCRRIKTRSCFVEDQNPRLLQKGSCDSKPLTLATG
jgi:hypothetical protein